LPAVQLVQPARFAASYVPAGQAEQPVASGVGAAPALHALHAHAPAAAYVPAGQLRQVDPSLDEYVPAPQSVH
jgi:hypothetical protein